MSKIQFQKTTLIIAIIFLVIISWLIFTPCPVDANINQNLPDYIRLPWPPPDTEVWLGCYLKKSILGNISFKQQEAFSIEIFPFAFADKEIYYPDSPPFRERISLFLDGEIVNITSVDVRGQSIFGNTNDSSRGYQLDGPYTFGSSHFLFFGKHTARVVIITGSGEKLEYEWSFRIK